MSGPEQNIRNAVAYLKMGLDEREPEKAVATYVGDVYIQHNPNVADGKEGFIDMVHTVFDPAPQGTPPVLKKSIASDDHVVLFQHVVGPDGSPGKALIDILRFDENGKIVEHWDVIQDIPDPSAFKHSNGFF